MIATKPEHCDATEFKPHTLPAAADVIQSPRVVDIHVTVIKAMGIIVRWLIDHPVENHNSVDLYRTR